MTATDMSLHTCHAEGCETTVPPRLFACRKHWFMLPQEIRDAVWREYSPGQERRKDPSAAYLAVTRDAIEFIAKREGRR